MESETNQLGNKQAQDDIYLKSKQSPLKANAPASKVVGDPKGLSAPMSTNGTKQAGHEIDGQFESSYTEAERKNKIQVDNDSSFDQEPDIGSAEEPSPDLKH